MQLFQVIINKQMNMAVLMASIIAASGAESVRFSGGAGFITQGFTLISLNLLPQAGVNPAHEPPALA